MNDARGLAVTSGSAGCVAALDRTAESCLAFRADIGAQVNAAVEADPGAPLPHLLKGCLGMLLAAVTASRPAGAPLPRLKAALGDTPLDLLFANAGAGGGKSQSFGSVDVDDVLQLIRINALVPLKLVEALADHVARSPRKLIAFQSSLMGSVGDNGSGGYSRTCRAAIMSCRNCRASIAGMSRACVR